MTSFVDVFGGAALQPSEVAYRAVALSANVVLVWPPYATDANYLASIMDTTPTTSGLSMTLPEATLASTGASALFTNRGSDTYTVKDADGGTVATVAAGANKLVFLADNTTDAGVWHVTTVGAGTSNLDAGALAGYGLTAISATLNAASSVSTVSADFTVASTDRAATRVWTGGAGTISFPDSTAFSAGFFVNIRNQGTGTLTLEATAGLIDGVASVDLQVGDSAIVHANTVNWYTVGMGRADLFNFYQLAKSISGGEITLSLTEAANVIQTYSGTLSSNQTVNFPQAVQVYYVQNDTSGGYQLQFRSSLSGTTAYVPQGTACILVCDGTNVYNASTPDGSSALFPPSVVELRGSTYPTLTKADIGKTIGVDGGTVQAFDSVASLGYGWYVDVLNYSGSTDGIRLEPDGSETIDNKAYITVYPGEGFRVIATSDGLKTVGRSNMVVLGTYTLSTVASLDLERGFTDPELNELIVRFENVAVTAGGVTARVKRGGSYVSTNTYSYYGTQFDAAGSVPTNYAAVTQSAWHLSGGVNASGLNGDLRVIGPANNGTLPITGGTAVGGTISYLGTYYESTNLTTGGIRLLGTNMTGVVQVRGIRTN